MKQCNECKRMLPLDRFEKSKSCKDGFGGTCKECRYKKKLKKFNCQICGESFMSSHKNAKYCGSICQGIARRRRTKTNCSFCDKPIEVINSKFEKWKYFYCNQKCRTEHLRTLVKGEANPNYSKIKFNCNGCGKSIEITIYEKKNLKHHFCSYECYKNNIGKFYTGPNNCNWNHNLTDKERLIKRRYPAYYKWRKQVYERDNYTCKCCNSSTGGDLIAHHILNYSSHKHLRTDINNGITLCKKCHKEFHNYYGYYNNTQEQLNEFMKKASIK